MSNATRQWRSVTSRVLSYAATIATTRWMVVAHAGRKMLGDSRCPSVVPILISYCAFSVSGILVDDELIWHSIRCCLLVELGQYREAVLTKCRACLVWPAKTIFAMRVAVDRVAHALLSFRTPSLIAPIVVLGFIGCTESDHADLPECSAVELCPGIVCDC